MEYSLLDKEIFQTIQRAGNIVLITSKQVLKMQYQVFSFKFSLIQWAMVTSRAAVISNYTANTITVVLVAIYRL